MLGITDFKASLLLPKQLGFPYNRIHIFYYHGLFHNASAAAQELGDGKERQQPWGSKPQRPAPPLLHFRLDLTRYGPERSFALGMSPAACPLGFAGEGEIQKSLDSVERPVGS